MTTTNSLSCDGCGQPASPEHIASRLKRLEWTTRYRPVHISTLFLGASSPTSENEFLYAGKFAGEAACLLDAVGIVWKDKSPESVLAEFRRGGFFLAHLLECPLEKGTHSQSMLPAQVAQRLPAVAARIRRSLKPKRIVMFSQGVESVLPQFSELVLGCPLILDGAKPFALDGTDAVQGVTRLREALLAAGVAVS